MQRQKQRIQELSTALRRHRLGSLPKSYYTKTSGDNSPHITRNSVLKNQTSKIVTVPSLPWHKDEKNNKDKN